MSNLESQCTASDSKDCPQAPVVERIAARTSVVGDSLPIRRHLPSPRRRMIGAWCFLDHAGPVAAGAEMRVGPHPHIGLQTFTWMIEGTLLHRDSLGSEQRIRPGQVNLMTAGRGISHSEESVPDTGEGLHLAQLWIALPEAKRGMDPAFQHYPDLPVNERAGLRTTVLAGEYGGAKAPAQVHTPLLGLDLSASADADRELELDPQFEHGLVALVGEADVDGERLSSGELLYFGTGRRRLRVRCAAGTRLLLVGGVPFAERILLWWNFVARTQDEVEQATRDWNSGDRFGVVRGYVGDRLKAPDLAGLHLRGA